MMHFLLEALLLTIALQAPVPAPAPEPRLEVLRADITRSDVELANLRVQMEQILNSLQRFYVFELEVTRAPEATGRHILSELQRLSVAVPNLRLQYSRPHDICAAQQALSDEQFRVLRLQTAALQARYHTLRELIDLELRAANDQYLSLVSSPDFQALPEHERTAIINGMREFRLSRPEIPELPSSEPDPNMEMTDRENADADRAYEASRRVVGGFCPRVRSH